MKTKLGLSDNLGVRVVGPPVVVLELAGGEDVELRPGEGASIGGANVRLMGVYYPNKHAEGPPHKYLIRAHFEPDGDEHSKTVKAMDEANARRLFLQQHPTAEIQVVEQL